MKNRKGYSRTDQISYLLLKASCLGVCMSANTESCHVLKPPDHSSCGLVLLSTTPFSPSSVYTPLLSSGPPICSCALKTSPTSNPTLTFPSSHGKNRLSHKAFYRIISPPVPILSLSAKNFLCPICRPVDRPAVNFMEPGQGPHSYLSILPTLSPNIQLTKGPPCFRVL